MDHHFLTDAYALLFGAEAKPEFYFIESAALQQAFKARAQTMTTASMVILDPGQQNISPELRNLIVAHGALKSLLIETKAVFVCAPETDANATRRKAPPPGWRPRAPEPAKISAPRKPHLRFGRWLVAHGAISLVQLIEALSWQRSHRQTAGAIALERGFITRDGLVRIIREQKRDEFFLDAAVRLGLMNETQKEVVLLRQKSMGMPLGAYFVAQKLLRPEQIEQLWNEYQKSR